MRVMGPSSPVWSTEAMSVARDRVLRRRMAVQRLTSSPLASPADVVRLLTCVQAQDAPLSRFSLGLRCIADDVGVRAAIDSGEIVRTHILRPTWHYVAAEDLRWILAVTSSKVESAMSARHRQLGLDDRAAVDRAHEVIAGALSGMKHLTRREISAVLAQHRLPNSGEQVGHLLLLAELRGLVCSGPLRGSTHTYALVDERVAKTPSLDRAEAIRQLTRRFFAGHGPAAVGDLMRWTTLNQGDIRPALAELGDSLDSIEVEGTTLWFDPELGRRPRTTPRAFLLPVFDEAYLSYARLNVQRAIGHPRHDQPRSFAEIGGGVVVCDRLDAGRWKRKEVGRDRIVVTLALASGLDYEQRAAVRAAAERPAVFTGRHLEIVEA
jgi:hypothetical protein